MTVPAPFSRRAEFDQTVAGWGSDPLADLSARLELIAELSDRIGPFTQAEEKTVAAMTRRQAQLRGAAQ